MSGNILGLIISILIFAGCGERLGVKSLNEVKVELVGFNPPKHVYIDIKHNSKIYKSIYISKHCSSRVYRMNGTIKINKIVYENDSVSFEISEKQKKQICA